MKSSEITLNQEGLHVGSSLKDARMKAKHPEELSSEERDVIQALEQFHEEARGRILSKVEAGNLSAFKPIDIQYINNNIEFFPDSALEKLLEVTERAAVQLESEEKSRLAEIRAREVKQDQSEREVAMDKARENAMVLAKDVF